MANVKLAMEYAAKIDRAAVEKRLHEWEPTAERSYGGKGGKMSYLKKIATEIATELCVAHGLDAHAAIEAALLVFAAACLRAEPTWQMEDIGVGIAGTGYRDCDNLSSGEASNVFRAMAEERAKYLEMK
jgi:hypothetical protein